MSEYDSWKNGITDAYGKNLEDNGEEPMFSKIKILKSNAGWFIGREYTDEHGMTMVGTRESSNYYSSIDEALERIVNGFTLRMCQENISAWNRGDLDTCPGQLYQDKDHWKQYKTDPNVDTTKYEEKG